MFFPCTGMPILKNDLSSVRLAVWLPVPLAVATAMEKSLTISSRLARWPGRNSVELVKLSVTLMRLTHLQVSAVLNRRSLKRIVPPIMEPGS